MNIKKTIKLFSISVLLLILITACGSSQSNIKEQETQSSIIDETVNADEIENEIRSEYTQENISETEITEETETTISEYEMQDWEKAYAEYMLDGLDVNEQNIYKSFTYSLIYVNDDDIPELVIDTGSGAGGSHILTFFDGEIDEVDILRSGLYYIERQNLVENSEGNFGSYYDFIYSIENGKWNNIAHGKRYENYVTENGLINEYFWEEEKVAKSTYVENINAIFDMEQAIEPTKYYIWDEMLSLLQTGSVKTVNHRYELFTDDVTWDMAQNTCREKGGYLATITSEEEFEYIKAQIDAEDKKDINFWVGASYNRYSAFGFCWLEPNEDRGNYNMLELYNALFQFWAPDEPSYDYEHCYAYLFYAPDKSQYFLGDTQDDMLLEFPEYAGKIGYICEYDN